MTTEADVALDQPVRAEEHPWPPPQGQQNNGVVRGTDEFAPYIAGLVRREQARRRQRRERAARALAAAQAAADLLRQRYSVTRVRAFGSILHPERFHERSDVDLAVEGLAPQDYLSAWAVVNGPGAEFEIDLVDLGDCHRYIVEAVEREGVDL